MGRNGDNTSASDSFVTALNSPSPSSDAHNDTEDILFSDSNDDLSLYGDTNMTSDNEDEQADNEEDAGVVDRITANSNKYAKERMGVYKKFGGQKWTNITVQEMVRFYGILLRISIESHHLGGYKVYFNPMTRISIDPRYIQKVKKNGG
eukprot:4918788-Ditylum_brightwellii.AAC.2